MFFLYSNYVPYKGVPQHPYKGNRQYPYKGIHHYPYMGIKAVSNKQERTTLHK